MDAILRLVTEIKDLAATNTMPRDQFWKVKHQKKDPTKYVVVPYMVGFTDYLGTLGICFEKKEVSSVKLDDFYASDDE